MSTNANEVGSEHETELKAFGFDAVIHGLYLAIGIISYILIWQLFDKINENDFRAFCASCFVFIAPFALDSLVALVSSRKKQKSTSIMEVVVFILGTVDALSLFVFLVFNVYCEIALWINILVSVVYLIKFGWLTGEATVLIYKEKKNKADKKERD